MTSSHDVYAVITLETAALDTPNEVAVLVTDAPTKCSPTVCPLWKSDKSSTLQYVHTKCWLNTICKCNDTGTTHRKQRNKQIEWRKIRTNKVLSVQPKQTDLFLYRLVFPLFWPSPVVHLYSGVLWWISDNVKKRFRDLLNCYKCPS